MQRVKISRVTAGIIIAGISALSSVAIATITAQSQASETATEAVDARFYEFKAKTEGDIKTLEGVVSQINTRLGNIDGALQSITSKLLNN